MDISSLIASYLISQGAHTGGHFYEANNYSDPLASTPIKLDAENLVEKWRANSNSRATDIHGAGFAMQDRIRDTIDDSETKKNVATMGALIKGLYLAGVPMMLSKQMNSGGDIEGMERTSGNKYTKHLIGASALADVYGIPVQFTTVDGAPGLMYTKRF